MSKKFVNTLLMAVVLIAQAMPVIAQESKEGWPQEIRIGLTPTMGRDVSEFYQPLIQHLKKRLGSEVKVFSAKDYDGILRGIKYKQIDIARMGAKSYVDAKREYDAEVLAAEIMTDGKPGYPSIIIAKKGSGIENMEQAKGKIFAFTDMESTSGYLVPSLLFVRDFKIDPKTYFREIKISGSHANSIMGVSNGSIDVAAISEPHIRRFTEKHGGSPDDFVILSRSELIPGTGIVARKDLPKSFKDAVRNAILEFNDDKEGLKKIDIGGFQIADDKMYDIVREMEALKEKLSSNK